MDDDSDVNKMIPDTAVSLVVWVGGLQKVWDGPVQDSQVWGKQSDGDNSQSQMKTTVKDEENSQS